MNMKNNYPDGMTPDIDRVEEEAYEHLYEKLNREPTREEVDNYLDQLADRHIGEHEDR